MDLAAPMGNEKSGEASAQQERARPFTLLRDEQCHRNHLWQTKHQTSPDWAAVGR